MESIKRVIEKRKSNLNSLNEDEISIYRTYEMLLEYRKNDSKNYVRLKTLIYYFPSIAIEDNSNLEEVLKHSQNYVLYVSGTDDDIKYNNFLDNFFREKYKKEPNIDDDYLSVEDFFNFFKI
jgi:hypothetical protein